MRDLSKAGKEWQPPKGDGSAKMDEGYAKPRKPDLPVQPGKRTNALTGKRSG